MILPIHCDKKTDQDTQEKAKTGSESKMPIGLTSQQNRMILENKDRGGRISLA